MSHRLVPLDVLRAVAVLLVLGRHLPGLERLGAGSRVTGLLELWQRGGWVGVDLFFVLSGFLVSGLLFREYEQYRRLRVGHFLIRRGLKIYPPFYLLLLFTVLIGLPKGSLSWPAVVCEALFVQNIGPALWGHTWSLAVEEHFYLFLALIFFWLHRRASATGDPFAILPRLTLGVAAVCLGLRLLNALLVPYGHGTHLFPTALRLDSLLFGVLLSHSFHTRPQRFISLCSRYRTPLVGGGALLLLLPFALELETTPFVYTAGLSLFYVAGGMLLCGLLGSEAAPGAAALALARVGRYSYSIYLWHFPLAAWVDRWIAEGRVSAGIGIGLYLVGAVVGGIGLAQLIEMPVLALRDRLFPSRSRPLESTAAAEVARPVAGLAPSGSRPAGGPRS